RSSIASLSQRVMSPVPILRRYVPMLRPARLAQLTTLLVHLRLMPALIPPSYIIDAKSAADRRGAPPKVGQRSPSRARVGTAVPQTSMMFVAPGRQNTISAPVSGTQLLGSDPPAFSAEAFSRADTRYRCASSRIPPMGSTT